jgi:hypothetical protein
MQSAMHASSRSSNAAADAAVAYLQEHVQQLLLHLFDCCLNKKITHHRR